LQGSHSFSFSFFHKEYACHRTSAGVGYGANGLISEQIAIACHLKTEPMAGANHNLRVRLLGATIALAVSFAAAGSGRADCGDYVSMDRHIQAIKSGDLNLSHQNLPSPPGKPCTGPFCSGRPLPLPPAPTSTVRAASEEFAIAIVVIDPSELGSARSCPPITSLLLSCAHSPIYHPPR
jgi:hypothetical protein